MRVKKNNSPSTKSKRASQDEILGRIDALLQLKATGCMDSQLISGAMKQWNISRKQAQRYLQEVETLERDLVKGDPLGFYCLQLNRVRLQYYKANQANDIATALKATELEGKIIEKITQEKRYAAVKAHPSDVNKSDVLVALQFLEAPEEAG